jgi:hypothetical protein
MHRHDHDLSGVEAPRPHGTRADGRAEAHLWRAAAAGRADVVGPAGMLQLQRAAGNEGLVGMIEQERSPVLDVVSSGGGRPLDGPVRADMEARLGARFDDVRVHTDDAAHRSAVAVDAHAYTVGSDVVFQRGTYDPGSTEGRRMLAHELTHVVQQRNGPVDGTSTGDGVSVSSPSDRFEREAAATADRVVADPGPGPAPVQRESEEELEKPLQAASVQRATDVDDEEPAEEPVQGAAVQRLGGGGAAGT